jgi:oligopeptide transport system substrate-binding protein
VDKAKIISLVYNDAVVLADGIVPEGMAGYNEELTGTGYDVERALELIALSSYGDVSNLPEITITTGGYGGQISSLLEAVINEWQVNLGVEVTVRQLEPDEFLYYISEEKDGMFLWGWSADYPHPQDFLEILFGAGSEGNYGEYSNVEVDEHLEALL